MKADTTHHDAGRNKKGPHCAGLNLIGSSTWARTRDLRINSPALYQLSYRGMEALNYNHKFDAPVEPQKSIAVRVARSFVHVRCRMLKVIEH